jgi:hypothetical protein
MLPPLPCCVLRSAADAAAAFVDEVLGTATKQQVLAVDEFWHGLRCAYPAEFTVAPSASSTASSWLPYGTSSSSGGGGGAASSLRSGDSSATR